MSDLPPGYTVRAATLDDVEIAVELVNLCSIDLLGRPEWEAHQFRSDWQSPSFDPTTDLHLVFTPAGKLVGYGGVWGSAPHVRMFAWGNVHPEHRRLGIGTHLARWVEARARRSIVDAPEGARVVVEQSKLVSDSAAHELLTSQGYTQTRCFSRMVIEMDGPPPEAVVPPGLAIRTFDRETQLRALVVADREAFRDHWGSVESPFQQDYEEWVRRIETDPDHDPSLWFLGMEGDEIAGMALCTPKVVEDPEAAAVDSLAVRRPWRRRGLALALLHHSFGELHRRGKRKVALDVDAQSLTGATRLYERAGMRVERQSVHYEKELRPGIDLSTQALGG